MSGPYPDAVERAAHRAAVQTVVLAVCVIVLIIAVLIIAVSIQALMYADLHSRVEDQCTTGVAAALDLSEWVPLCRDVTGR